MRGFAAVRKASEDITERKNSGSGEFAKELWPGLRNNGSSVVVRFLEQGDEVQCAWMHEYKKPNQNRSFFVACLDQNDEGNPCPACEAKAKRVFKGYINVIWRDSPQLKRDAEGKAIKENGEYAIDGTKDEVVVWVQGITVFEDLADKDITYRGLSSRDFRVTRRGTGLNTKYVIDPADPDAGATPLSDADVALANEKFDISEHYLKTSAEDLESIFVGGGVRSTGGVTEEQVSESKSPFQRNTERGNRFL
jgi:hypothetical protein